MPSSFTKNYKLNQWEADDRVLRTDFNSDNAKIDAALAGKAEKSVVTSLQGTLDAAKATIPRIFFGTYTGSGTASRLIDLGFTPKAVLVFMQDGTTQYSNAAVGGLAMPGLPAKIDNGSKVFPGVTVTDSGFQVYFDRSDDYYRSLSNTKGVVYYYIAFA